MKRKIAQKIRRSKERITKRLKKAAKSSDSGDPVFKAKNIKYELGDRGGAISMGGIGAVHKFVKKIGLATAIDNKIELLKFHKPYHESDHVLNIAYNAMCGGKVIQDIEQQRQDENFLNALGAEAMPDPTTAGDFCRRFTAESIHDLMDTVNEKRKDIWAKQPESFFEIARIDADGTTVPTSAKQKSGVDIAYNGVWGYHPLIVSLANTGELLYIVNRSGNVPSHDGSAKYFDMSISLLKEAGFKKILLRGDTDFSLTTNFDRWNRDGVKFVFGYDARKNLIESVDLFEDEDWNRLERRSNDEFDAQKRQRSGNQIQEIINKRGFKQIRLKSEDVIEFLYQPVKCDDEYRVVAVRKNLETKQYGEPLFEHHRYFFYITNDEDLNTLEVVKESCERCNQENLIEQQKNGVNGFKTPLDSLESNWAWMVMSSLAWTLKAWIALSIPARQGPNREKQEKEAMQLLRMEFRTFIAAFMNIPAQIVRSGRQLTFRLLGWNPWQHLFFRFLDGLE